MRPLIHFLALAYGLSWLIWSPLWLPALGVTGLPVLPYHHAVGGLGPMIAAFVCSWRAEGAAGARTRWKRMVDVRSFIHGLVALLAPFFLLGIAMAFGAAPFDAHGILRNREFPDMGFLTFLAYNLLFFGFGEETGWRGFVLPRLQRRMNALGSSVLLTLVWSLWHWPLFLYRPGYVSMDLGGIVGWVFSLLTGSILLTWLFNGSRGSLLVVAVFHATVDIAFTCEAATPAVIGTLGMLITVWGVATVLILRPRNLSRAERVTASAE